MHTVFLINLPSFMKNLYRCSSNSEKCPESINADNFSTKKETLSINISFLNSKRYSLGRFYRCMNSLC